jgi:hypothetical protein
MSARNAWAPLRDDEGSTHGTLKSSSEDEVTTRQRIPERQTEARAGRT